MQCLARRKARGMIAKGCAGNQRAERATARGPAAFILVVGAERLVGRAVVAGQQIGQNLRAGQPLRHQPAGGLAGLFGQTPAQARAARGLARQRLDLV